MTSFEKKVHGSLEHLEAWIERSHYKGYEPFDGLSSPFSKLSFGNLYLKRVLQQAVRRIPVNIRPFLLIRRQESTKGRAYVAQGYMHNYKRTGDESYKERSIQMLKWLDENKSPNYTQHSWANHFDVAFRGGFDPAHEPIIVWTSLAGQAFLDAYELYGDRQFLSVAQSVSRFIIDVLPRETVEDGLCLSYIRAYQRSIHNANMLGAAFLARFGKMAGDSEALELARKAMTYSCNRQREDGSWWYGEQDHYHWIDNFHTGYNLDSLKTYIESTGDNEFKPILDKGIEFYRNSFFEDGRIPKYYHDRTFPVDIQCAAQSIETLVNFSAISPECRDLAEQCTEWVIDNMQNRRTGSFYYRVYRHTKDRTPMIHWGQSTMYKALSSVLSS